MKVIGLTGGIGTGKSTAAAYLKDKGFAHVDADEISRGLTADGSPMLQELDRVFGPEGEMGAPGVKILKQEACLDRKALASLVFSDEKKRKKLDEMMFGEIIRRIDSEIRLYQRLNRNSEEDESGKGIVWDGAVYGLSGEETECPGILLDAPLLFEAGLDEKCDLVLLLIADEQVRIHRVCQRDGVTVQEVRNRINSQMSDAEKKKRADLIVDNSGSQEQLYAQLDRILESVEGYG